MHSTQHPLVLLHVLCFQLLLAGNQVTNVHSDMARIIKGDISGQAKWPFMAAIMYEGGQYCGGVVWNQDTILTAAHCVYVYF